MGVITIQIHWNIRTKPNNDFYCVKYIIIILVRYTLKLHHRGAPCMDALQRFMFIALTPSVFFSL